MSFEEREVWTSYANDAAEALQEIEESILVLEADPAATAELHGLYRGLHSLKGNSGFLRIETVERLAHVSEDLIGLVRDGGVALDRDIVDLMLKAIDELRRLVERAATERRNPPATPELEALCESIVEAYSIRGGGGENHAAGGSFGLFSDAPGAPDGAATGATTDQLEMLLAVARAHLPAIKAATAALRAGGQGAEHAVEEAILRVLEPAKRVESAEVVEALERVVSAAKGGEPTMLDRAEADVQAAFAAIEARFRGLSAEPESFGFFESAKPSERAAEDVSTPPSSIGVAADDESSSSAQSPKPARARPEKASADEVEPKTEFIRVDARKISLLLDLASEIGLAAGAVTHHPSLEGLELEGYAAASHKLELLVREMQNEVSAMRLVPVSGVFQKMKRVVRDTAKRTGKEVELVLEGEETEIDKVMVDALQDPLVHVLRNAIDHGIELPEERLAAGKPAVGQIVLSASHQGGEVSIEVVDDGKGIDRAAIVARATARGLVAEGAELTDEQKLELLFEPGFSTKETIDELSGRGVGMDVVRTIIAGLRGRTALRSVQGKGTHLTMTMPLTLAFVEAMVVRESDRLFALPIEKVFEVFKVEAARVAQNSADGQVLVRVRNNLVPVLWLHRFWGEASPALESLDGRILVVVQTSRGEYALPVDALLGNQQVMLKPLRGPLAGIRAAAGCGMLRTGDVALALDCEQLHV
jgi:two-component system chemotaxis sensor kinase CheA